VLKCTGHIITLQKNALCGFDTIARLKDTKMAETAKICRLMVCCAACVLPAIAGCERWGREVTEPSVAQQGQPAEAPSQPAEPAKQAVEPAVQIQQQQTPGAPARPAQPEAKTQEQQAPEKQAFVLALKFNPQDTTRYRAIIEAERSVQWEGPEPTKPSAFKGGRTGNRIEMTFTQKIRSIDDKGNAVADITIESLKYLGKVRDNIIMDFDSSRQKDQNEPLAKLPGQSYTIEISPAGQVSKVIDVNQAQSAVKGVSSSHTTALQLLSADAIGERHTISALDGADKKQLHAGDSWSSVKTFSFGMMGSRSLERIYPLKDVTETDNRQLATIQLNAIPSSQMAKDLHKEEGSGFFAKMFDNTEAYTGRLTLDLTAGKVEEYLEQLKIEWVAADQPSDANDQAPAALKMTAVRSYHVERIR